jgi:hypothetical protein
MSEVTSTEKTTKAEGSPAEKAGKPKKANARDMLREAGKVKKAKPPKEPRAKKERVAREDLVVFAFRLTKEQRDTIHAAAGPAKASQFVLAAAMAAAAKQK